MIKSSLKGSFCAQAGAKRAVMNGELALRRRRFKFLPEANLTGAKPEQSEAKADLPS